MTSPFSQEMLQTLSRLTSTLTPDNLPMPTIITGQPSIMEPDVIEVPKPSRLSMIAPYKMYLKKPVIIFTVCFIVLFGIGLFLRHKLIKTPENRPSLLQLFMYTLIALIPVFFWFFIKK
jgi:hypothetical protein